MWPIRSRSPSWRTVGTTNEATRSGWIAAALAEIPPGGRLLDAGAGEQQYRQYCGHLEYVSQDFGQYRPDTTVAGLHDDRWEYGHLEIISDIGAIPEPDGSFDAVLCTEVFEHIPDPLLAIGEFSRLLRPGGQLIITAPFCSLTHQGPFHFATGFNRYFFETHFPAFGFEIVALAANGNYFEYVAQELRRVRSVARRYGDARTTPADLAATVQLLRMLARFSRSNTGSNELAVFGYHVRAARR